MRKGCDARRESEKTARLIFAGTKAYRKINRSLPKITENMFQHIRHFKGRTNEMDYFKEAHALT